VKVKVSENKKNTGLKVAVIIVSAFLVVSIIINVYFYTRQYGDNGLETRVVNLQNQLDDLTINHQNYVSDYSHSNIEYDVLENDRDSQQSKVTNLQSDIDQLENVVEQQENEIDQLQDEIDGLKAPKLMTRLGANDVRPLFSASYMEISGTVWNVGTNTAYDCRIHIVLYQGSTVAKATYIDLGSIDGETWKDVTEKIYYEGSAITNWEMDIEYK